MSALVDIEVYDAAGHQVFQRWYDNQSFAAGQSRTYKQVWDVPANATVGSYTVKIGIFSTHWSGKIYGWNDRAATFSVK